MSVRKNETRKEEEAEILVLSLDPPMNSSL